MAEVNLTCGFFNALLVDGVPDRAYNCTELNDHLAGLVSDSGIYATVSSACQVVAGNGMEVIVKTGRGKVDNHWFMVSSDTSVTISEADVILGRIDAVVVRMNATDRTISLAVVEGELATTPVKPTLTRNDDVYEIALCYVTVSKNITAITTTMIEDVRSNKADCGWIVGLIEEFDTTTLYNQYKEAQEEFINEKTAEFEAWAIQSSEAFNTWFNGNKETLQATNLYREYSATYKTVTANESTFDIPESIHYTNNGLDILNVLINGFKITDDKITVNTEGTQVTLSFVVDTIGTEIEFVNKKCVEGNVAESTVQRVEALEETVASLSGADEYACTGTDDNISLSDIVRAFLDGTGNYSGVADTASLNIKVVGTLGISTLIDGTTVFEFNSTVSSNRRVYVDFSNATIPALAFTASTLAVFSAVSNVHILNATVKANYSTAGTFYGFHGGNAKDCKLIINGSSTSSQTIYGGYACDEFNNNEVTLTGSTAEANKYGVYSCTKVLTNTINMSVGVSIRANGNQLLMGNIINTTVSKSGSVVELGTLTV